MRTWVLRTLIASIALTSAAAIGALVSPEFGEVQEKTLFTTLTFSAASLNAMACATAWNQQRRVAFAPAWGIVLSYLVFALIAVAIWAETEDDTFFRILTTLAIVAVVGAHASLLRRTPLMPRAELIAFAAIVAAMILAAMILVWIWTDEGPGDFELRLLGLVGVTLAATTIAAPVVHLLTRGHESDADRVSAEVARFCPRCGSALDGSAGRNACVACGARFEVRFEG